MAESIERKMQKVRQLWHNLKQKLIVRVWNLGSRLDPKQIREEKKKKKRTIS